MRWDDDDPGLPIKFGPCANDEYDPMPLSPVVRETIRRARLECEENARRAGMSRRRFLLSACAAATTLLALQGCDDEARQACRQAEARWLVQDPEGRDDGPDDRERRARRHRAHLRRPEPPARLHARPAEPGRGLLRGRLPAGPVR